MAVSVCKQKDSWDGGERESEGGGGERERKGGGGYTEYTAAECICSIRSLRNRSRILPACVATCQNLSS